MAFPTIPTVAAGRVFTATQANNSGARTFPSLSGLTKNSGDLLIAICVAYQSNVSPGSVFSGWTGGFTEFLDVGGNSNVTIGAAYKISTGSETGTFQVTQAATVTGHAAMFVLSIPGAHPSIIPVGGTIVNATTGAADIAALNPSTWGTLDTLWIAVAGNGENATTGSFNGITAAPTNYTSFATTGISSDVVGGMEAAVAFRQLNAASEDPGSFTVDTSATRTGVVLLGICPAPTRVTIAQAQETDSPQTVSGTTAASNFDLTLVTETDTVGEIVPLQPLPALVTASAQPLSTQSGHNITTATTTASAQALDADKAVTITLASETDASLSFSGVALTRASETDTAQPLSYGTFTLTPATETDLAGDIVELQPLPALETDAPQVLVATQDGVQLTPATSTASAQVLSFTQGGGYSISRATETDLANTIVSLQPLPATVTASAQALSVTYGGKNITYVTETDSAPAIAPSAGIILPEWETSVPLPYNQQPAVGDVSTAVALSVTGGIGPNRNITFVTETDTAEALIVGRRVTIALVTETASVQALTKYKPKSITTATSTATAIGLSFTQAGATTYTIQPAVSTDTATTASIFKPIFMTLGIVTSVNTARLTRAANRPSGGLVLVDHEPATGLTLTDHTQAEDLALIDI